MILGSSSVKGALLALGSTKWLVLTLARTVRQYLDPQYPTGSDSGCSHDALNPIRL